MTSTARMYVADAVRLGTQSSALSGFRVIFRVGCPNHRLCMKWWPGNQSAQPTAARWTRVECGVWGGEEARALRDMLRAFCLLASVKISLAPSLLYTCAIDHGAQCGPARHVATRPEPPAKKHKEAHSCLRSKRLGILPGMHNTM